MGILSSLCAFPVSKVRTKASPINEAGITAVRRTALS
jgi:hypothetical protein